MQSKRAKALIEWLGRSKRNLSHLYSSSTSPSRAELYLGMGNSTCGACNVKKFDSCSRYRICCFQELPGAWF